jgi:hypothetical protein
MSPGKWCHFKQRLQRPLSLKSAKSHATLDWEDEPFSFVAFARKGAGQQEQGQGQGQGQELEQGQRRVPERPLLEGHDVSEGENWGWGRVLWPTIHVCCCCCFLLPLTITSSTTATIFDLHFCPAQRSRDHGRVRKRRFSSGAFAPALFLRIFEHKFACFRHMKYSGASCLAATIHQARSLKVG